MLVPVCACCVGAFALFYCALLPRDIDTPVPRLFDVCLLSLHEEVAPQAAATPAFLRMILMFDVLYFFVTSLSV